MSTFNQMQQIKRQFFALRNGIIADTIRKAGGDYKIIFGLNIPQLRDIAQSIGKNKELSLMLFDNDTTRESLLLAPMIYPVDNLTLQDAIAMVCKTKTYETADTLSHSLLRHFNNAKELCSELIHSDNIMAKYTGLRLFLNLQLPLTDEVVSICKSEIENESSLKYISRQVLDSKI